MSNVAKKTNDSMARTALILLMICAAAGLFLGFANEVTKGPIAAKKEAVNQAAYEAVFPEAINWKKLDITNENYTDVQEVYECSDGYAMRIIGKGYAGDDIEMVVGISYEGVITGMRIVSHSETAGLGAKAAEAAFYTQFDGRSAENEFVPVTTGSTAEDEIDAITGATKTTRGVVNAMNRACGFYLEVLKEGR